MQDIEFRRAPYQRRWVEIGAFIEDRDIGWFDYLPSLHPDKDIKLGLLFVKPEYRDRGIAKLLIHELVRDIGTGTQVVGTVNHTKTWHHLERISRNRDMARKRYSNIEDPNLIKYVPITRLLESGGIEVVRFRVTYHPQVARFKFGNIYAITFRGITRE